MSAYLESVETYLAEAAGGPGQKRAAYRAAQAVDAALPAAAEILRPLLWAWLTSGRWLNANRPVEWSLPDDHRLSEDAVKAHYGNVAYRQAIELATAAWETRVKRCAEALDLGWPPEDCVAFCYTREEFREAVRRVGKLRTG